MSNLTWQKSSFSTGDPNQNCLEVAQGPEGHGVRLRESEDPAAVLTTTPTRLAALLRCLRQGPALPR
ncbi:DUF397 domain-containing protein [Streptomyces sp. 6N223]|uniref:DUF397 domain-containing protein n=1 Tax=Streptomyces sp. 6N223 TaxID=3457412 RepID=UPI003FD207A0